MKKIFLSLLLTCSVFLSKAQNYLPFNWKISFNDTTLSASSKGSTSTWKDVNLQLSWERQGYFNRLGKCALVTDFDLQGWDSATILELNISLQCHVHQIFMNGKYIGGNIANQFWTNKGAKSTFSIPPSVLRRTKNRIIIIASDLSYTGGKSYNYVSLTSPKSLDNSNINIHITNADHLFSDVPKHDELQVRYMSKTPGTISTTIVNDFHDTIYTETTGIDAGHGVLKIKVPEALKPGFYEITTVMKNDGYCGDVSWLTLSPEKISCSREPVADLQKYWDEAYTELSNILPDYKLIPNDSLSNERRNAYILEFRSIGNVKIRGYYFVPKKPGNYPVILHLPGYGYGFQNLEPFINQKEPIAELALCIRGHGISTDDFNPGFDIPGMWGYEFCDRYKNAYRGAYMDCVRAIDFLRSRTEIDTTKVGVTGGSQGGGLALATAALCKEKVQACAFFDPFPADIRHQIKIRTLMNIEIAKMLNYYKNQCSVADVLAVQEYIDTRMLASWITSKVYFATALFDDDCPPHVGFAAYNNIHSEKKYKIYPNDSHLGESGYPKVFMSFFKEEFEF
ncbi:acetylxylan esterase [Arcticibacter tournemirensis]